MKTLLFIFLWCFMSLPFAPFFGMDSAVTMVLGFIIAASIMYAIEVGKEKAAEEDAIKIKCFIEDKQNELKEKYKLNTKYFDNNLDMSAFICLDETIGKLYLDTLQQTQSSEKKQYSPKIINLKDIKKIEVKENGVGLFSTRTDSGTALASAAVGGALFGGAGAVVGALAGNEKTIIESILLSFHIKDLEEPIIFFDFLGAYEVNKGSEEYRQLTSKAEIWVLRVLEAIDQQKENQNTQEIISVNKANPLDQFESYKNYLLWCSENDSDPLSRENFIKKKEAS